MKQTIDNLSKWVSTPTDTLLPFWTDEDMKIIERVWTDDKGGYCWQHHFQDIRDAAFMAALTSKAGLPYVAKLTALLIEQ